MKYLKKFEDMDYDKIRKKSLRKLRNKTLNKKDAEWFNDIVKKYKEEGGEDIVHGVDDIPDYSQDDRSYSDDQEKVIDVIDKQKKDIIRKRALEILKKEKPSKEEIEWFKSKTKKINGVKRYY